MKWVPGLILDVNVNNGKIYNIHNGKIYKISNILNDIFYICFTCDTLNACLSKRV
jgi:hypothetical protein